MQTGSVEGAVVAGRYRLDSRLGSGGMGTVWAAEDELLQRRVAVKEVTVPAGLPAPEVERMHRRYLREARAAARLRHENVVVVHDVIPETGRVWIVMELVEARDLATVVQEDGALQPAAAARIGLQLLAALGAAHDAGVLHRDVKPANVLICPNGRVVLTDFGVASVAGDGSLTITGQLIGSPAYLAPERLTGAAVGPASDLWSLGCTLYVAVEAVSPFWREEPFAMLSAITVEGLPEPRSAGALTPVLYGLLEKDQAERWDAVRTRDALEQVVAGGRVEAVPSWGAPSESTGAGPRQPVHDGPERATEPAKTQPRSESPATGADAERPAAAEPERPGDQPNSDPPDRPTDESTFAQAGGRRRRSLRFRLTAGALTVLVIAVAAGAVVMTRQVTGLPWLTARAEATEPSHSPAEVPPPLTYLDPHRGYRIDVPSTWRHSCPNGRVCRFIPPDSEPRVPPGEEVVLQVVAEPAGGKTSLELAASYDQRLARDGAHPGYRRVELGWASFGQYRGAVLEFLFRGPDNQTRHALIFRTVSRGISYEVSFAGTTNGVQHARSVFDQATQSLQVPE